MSLADCPIADQLLSYALDWGRCIAWPLVAIWAIRFVCRETRWAIAFMWAAEKAYAAGFADGRDPYSESPK